jgi:hypothetical protein
MIYIQGFLTLLGAYLFIANYLKHDDLLDFEGIFEKLFGVKKEETISGIAHKFYFEQADAIEYFDIDNTAFNNSPWTWAVPMANEWPRLYLFESIERKLDSIILKTNCLVLIAKKNLKI